jgi:7-cyano-7-deazaguanine synthase in queuosine biosynthesis
LKTDVEFLDLTGDLKYGVSASLEKLATLGLQPTEAALDLVLLAAMVFGADTRVPRKTESQDGWTREMEINLPVKDPKRWDQSKKNLERALKFLTGDIWHLSFRARSEEHETLVGPVQAKLVEYSSVSLFSGGLDSYISAVDVLSKGETPLFVSHYYASQTSSCQSLCSDHLTKKFPGSVMEFFRSRIGFDHTMIPAFAKDKGEKTERSRSFLFFSLAALAASCLRKPVKILVPENGLIALNVPLERLRLGALSTRTTHPFFIARFNELVRTIGVQAEYDNPYKFKTKGEMARDCADPKFVEVTAKDTSSCSSPNKGRWKKISAGHCGFCMPCLIRRASMKAAFGKDSTDYGLELKGVLNSRQASGRHVRAFQIAFERLHNSKNYAAAAVRIPGPLSDCEKDVPELTDVYIRGMEEVEDLLKSVKTRPS